MQSDQLPYLLALSKIKGIGPKSAKLLVSYSGGFEAVFNQSKKQLLAIPNIGELAAKLVLDADPFALAEDEMRFLDKHSSIQILPYTADTYPSRFRNHEDSPLFVYYKGKVETLQAQRTIGIVGTRDPSSYGEAVCHQLVGELAEYNVCVVSGLAYGIDTAAHRACVEFGVPTIGMLGNGIDNIYPASNKRLATDMQESGGLLSEFHPGALPAREHFPMRNRLIAALSDAVIVVESAKKGGSIITAELANSYNKDVFAIPGRINEEKSEGCNLLIKSNKAVLLQSVKDIGYIMGWDKGDTAPRQMELALDLTADELGVVTLLKELDSPTIDQLHYRLELPPSSLSSMLLNLEFKGIVRSLPGKKYTLARK
jgi:DNA processing protein